MRKYWITFLILISSTSLVFAQKTLTINSFYPSPFGAYDRIRLEPRGLVLCDDNSRGVFLIDSSDNAMKACLSGNTFTPLSNWIESGDYIYPTPTNPSDSFDPYVKMAINMTGYAGILRLHVNSTDTDPPKTGDGLGLTSYPIHYNAADNSADPDISALPDVPSFPASGTHSLSKMFFQPKKAAFRAGVITNDPALGAIATAHTVWNEVHLGLASVGIGTNAAAMLRSSIAIGHHVTSRADHGVAIGHNGYVGGLRSVAISNADNITRVTGRDSVALGNDLFMDNDEAVSIGTNTSVRGNRSVAIGYDNVTVNDDYSIGIGKNISTTDLYSIAIGDTLNVTQRGMAIGENITASGNNAIGLGLDATATGCSSLAIGDVTAGGSLSVAIGETAQASNSSSVAIGSRVSAGINTPAVDECPPTPLNYSLYSGSVAIGADSTAGGAGSVAIGFNSHALAKNAVAIGQELTINGENSLALGWKTTIDSDRTFVINQDPTPSPDPLVVNSPGTTLFNYGNVGVGTDTPAARLDVEGAVRVGFSIICNAAREGAIQYNTTINALEFCNGTDWVEVGKGGLLPNNVYFTDGLTNGNAGGYQNLYNFCNAGDHVCSAVEVSNWLAEGNSLPAGRGWVIGHESDCLGYTSSVSGDQGTLWNSAGANEAVILGCSTARSVVCCEYD